MRYDDYEIEDFVKDAFFQQWVLTQDVEIERYWSQWVSRRPEKRFIIEEARKTVLLLGFTTDRRQNEQFLKTWQSLDKAWVMKGASRPVNTFFNVQLYRIAAAFAFLVLSAATLWYFTNRKITIDTRFSEIKSVTLPDGSVIDLNANSSIAYYGNWDKRNAREVWLVGEAFFSVAHDANKKFVVHTSDGIHVNVLGTTFNVKSRRNTTRVSLNSGKIEVNLDERFLKGDKNKGRGFVMLPGEVAEFNNKTSEIKRLTAIVERYTLWKDKKIVFDNTSMKEVAVMLQDIYGLRVTLDAQLEGRRITGEFKSDDLDILLRFIARALQANVTRNEVEIHFGSHNSSNKTE